MKRTVTLHRRLSLTKALIRITLEPWGEGEQVKIVKLERKPKGSSRYQRLKDEEGHVYPFTQLGFSQRHYEEVFADA